MDEGLSWDQAVRRARRLAKDRGESIFVVREGSDYGVGDEADLDTWWLGATVCAEVQSDGTVLSD